MRILYIEPFSAGSHARFGETLTAALAASWSLITLSGRHWKWHMRASAVYAALARAEVLERPHDLLFASSYLPLAELVGLRPDLGAIPRVLYFHENQLAYPSQEPRRERDLHYGVTQMVSALAATECWFNSNYNRESFLHEAEALLARMPDAVAPGWTAHIRDRSRIVPLPLALPDVEPCLDAPSAAERALGPIILWNHRWEHDKNPEAFFEALFRLLERGVPFRVALAGERFSRVPPIFDLAIERLGARVIQAAPRPERADYEALLRRVHLAVSTSNHEFFGVALLEATHFGARPVAPRRLCYPEFFEDDDLYRDEDELVQMLEQAAWDFVAGRNPLRADRRRLTGHLLTPRVIPVYEDLFRGLVADRLRR